jgi:hypothetical protein
MSEWSEYERRLRERQEEEDAELIYRYGTADRKKIEEIEKKKKEDVYGGCFVILLLFVILPFIFMLICWLIGLDGGYAPSVPWSPRHT